MKVIIAGSRKLYQKDHDALNLVYDAVRESGLEDQIDEIVSGGAKGIDKYGEMYAKQQFLDLTIMPANWDGHGKSAGPRRNKRMAQYADALIAIPFGDSPGTYNMIDIARKMKLKVYVKVIE